MHKRFPIPQWLYPALRVLAVAVLLLALAGCARGTDAETDATPTLVPLLTPPTPAVEEEGGGFDFNIGGNEEPAPEVAPPPAEGEATPPPAEGEAAPPPATGFSGRFTDLRFATSGNGTPQANFPEGTEEVYAIWNYDGMSATDTMERLWYLNDQLEVEVREAWDYSTYGSVGAVRDVFYYDYIDGVDAGRWRVEIYLNGELHLSEEFTVGAP